MGVWADAYLYLEHGPQQITAVDITKKNDPFNRGSACAHGKIEPERYQQLFEGGTIESLTDMACKYRS